MKLFYSPIHGFIHKVLVVAHEAGIIDQIQRVPTYPMREDHDIRVVGKICQILDDFGKRQGRRNLGASS